MVRARLTRFNHVLLRPKQALQHLLELLIIRVATSNPTWEPDWVEGVVEYLAAVSDYLIPSVQAGQSAQWASAAVDARGKPVRQVPQMEECYPADIAIDASGIMHVIASVAPGLPDSPVSRAQLARMTGLMDEPAKTAVMCYSWFLASAGVPNGWLGPYLSAGLGRRERRARLPSHLTLPPDSLTAGGRLARVDEELHTLYAPPFIDRLGHLIWYTVRVARPGEIIGRPATSYARSNFVRIQSSKRLSRSVQIHHSHVCNADVLDWRLWLSWTHGARATGAFKSLAADSLSPRVVPFDKPVRIECALAVGFRVVQGVLVNPLGKRLVVVPHSDSLFKAKAQSCRDSDKKDVPWRNGLLFA